MDKRNANKWGREMPTSGEEKYKQVGKRNTNKWATEIHKIGQGTEKNLNTTKSQLKKLGWVGGIPNVENF